MKPRYFLAALNVCPMEVPRNPTKKLELSIEVSSETTDPASSEFRRVVTDATESFVNAFVDDETEMVSGFFVTPTSTIQKTWKEPLILDTTGITIWGLTCEPLAAADGQKCFGWYELELHAEGRIFTITAEVLPPGREPADLRNEIEDVGVHGLSSGLLELPRTSGAMRKLPGKPDGCDDHPKVLSGRDVRVWKVVIT